VTVNACIAKRGARTIKLLFRIQMQQLALYFICAVAADVAILVLFMVNSLNFSEDIATAAYHAFVVVCYLSPIVGAMLSDGWLGKFRSSFRCGFLPKNLGRVWPCLGLCFQQSPWLLVRGDDGLLLLKLLTPGWQLNLDDVRRQRGRVVNYPFPTQHTLLYF